METIALSAAMIDLFKKYGQSDDLNTAIAQLKATLKELTELATQHLTELMVDEFQSIRFVVECSSWACNVALKFYNPETGLVEIPDFYYSKDDIKSLLKSWDSPLSQFELRGGASSNSIMGENKIYAVRDDVKEMVWQSYRGIEVQSKDSADLIEAPKQLRVTIPKFNVSVHVLFLEDKKGLRRYCENIAYGFKKQKAIELKKINQQTLDL